MTNVAPDFAVSADFFAPSRLPREWTRSPSALPCLLIMLAVEVTSKSAVHKDLNLNSKQICPCTTLENVVFFVFGRKTEAVA